MLANKFLPEFDVSDKSSMIINTNSADVYKAVTKWQMIDNTICYMLWKMRNLFNIFIKSEIWQENENITFNSEAGKKTGLLLTLGVDKNRELVYGFAGKFWRPWSNLIKLNDVQHFKKFSKPGYSKAITTIVLIPLSDKATKIISISRIKNYGKKSNLFFSFYWNIVKPFHILIVKSIMKDIKHAAEAS